MTLMESEKSCSKGMHLSLTLPLDHPAKLIEFTAHLRSWNRNPREFMQNSTSVSFIDFACEGFELRIKDKDTNAMFSLSFASIVQLDYKVVA